MTDSTLIRIMVVVAAISGLTGCDTLKSAIGMERHVPDETQVAAHPALTLPPDYDLRPPGGATPVSSAHEAGLPAQTLAAGGSATTPDAGSAPAAASSAPAPAPKESKGFLSGIWDMFFGDDDKTATAPAAGK